MKKDIDLLPTKKDDSFKDFYDKIMAAVANETGLTVEQLTGKYNIEDSYSRQNMIYWQKSINKLRKNISL